MNKERLVACIGRDEGFRAEAYNDTEGIPTVGYGRNLRDVGWKGRKYASKDEFNSEYPDGISEQEARETLEGDVEQGISDAKRLAGDAWDSLSDLRQEILSNLSFNLGYSRFSKFRGAWRNLKAGDAGMTAMELADSKWARQVKRRSCRLFLAFALDDARFLEL